MRAVTASGIWNELTGLRSTVLTKVERYAALTISSLLLPPGVSTDRNEAPHDVQSVGAQAVNHLTNKVMLSMFAPSRPSMRIELGKKAKAQAQDRSYTAQLAAIERAASSQLDKKALRPALYRTIRLLIVTGNALQLREKDTMRVFALPNYCVKRTVDGRVHTLIVKEHICGDELDDKVRQSAGIPADSTQKVDYFRLVRLMPDGRYEETQWVDNKQLPADFTSLYTADNLPWDALCWSRADDADYGVGHVEEYSGDFEALSTLCASIVDGAVVGSEVRWLVSPTGITQVDDLKTSNNGDVLPGRPEDVNAVSAANSQALDIALKISQHWEQRVARGFLLMSALTRNAERVTAEEIRMTAMELETALGGVYSYLAHTIQLPLFRWFLRLSDFDPAGADIEIVVVTGLAALSRGADLENLAQAFDILGRLSQVPEGLLRRLKFDKLAEDVGAGCNVDLRPYLYTDAEVSKIEADQRAAQMVEDIGTQAGIAATQGTT